MDSFVGNRATFTLGQNCMNIQGKLNDYFSSVDAMDGCFLLFEHSHCRGRFRAVRGSVKDLTTLGINDAISSLRRCTSTESGNSPVARDVDESTVSAGSSSETHSSSTTEHEASVERGTRTNFRQEEDESSLGISSEQPLLLLPENSTS